MKNIQERWKDICNEYLKLFAKKHEFYIENRDEYNWVGGDPGTIAMLGDYFVDFNTIRYDIDHNVSENIFIQWYDYSLELYELGVDKNINFESYVKGLRPYSEDDISHMKELKKRVSDAQKVFDDCLKEIKNKKVW